jgi:hypothetical protein
MNFAPITPYPALSAFLIDIARTLESELADSFVGCYLVGSLAIGDFDLTSDVDFIVVIQDELTPSQLENVQRAHTKAYSQEIRWAKHLEYSFFPIGKLKVPSSPFSRAGRNKDESRNLWHFDHGGALLEKSDHDNSLVVRWTLRERAVVVLGPQPAEVFGVIPPDSLREEIRNTLIGWGRELLADSIPFRNRFFQAFIPLHFCRMMQDYFEGRVTSKREGAEWGTQNLDATWAPLIRFCWNERQDSEIHVSQPSDPTKFEEVLAFVEYCLEYMESSIREL